MLQFSCRPEIYKFADLKSFFKELKIGEGDLIFTSASLWQEEKFSQEIGPQFMYYKDYFTGEPTEEGFQRAYQEVAKGNFKRIIGIGGGSVMDVAKLLALAEADDLYALFTGEREFLKNKELILVPSTCGTGSEVTNISIIRLKEKDMKLGLVHEALFADKAVMIPALLETLSYENFMYSSIDALIHAIESILSPKANEYTRLYGYRALDVILTGYTKLAARGPRAQRELGEDFLVAANFAGLSFGLAGCGTIHAMSYPLGSTFHVTHGKANYSLMAGALNKYISGGLEGELLILCRHIAAVLYCEPCDAFTDLADLLEQLLPVERLSAYGVDEKLAEKWSYEILEKQDRLLKNSYRPLSREELYKIYLACL